MLDFEFVGQMDRVKLHLHDLQPHIPRVLLRVQLDQTLNLLHNFVDHHFAIAVLSAVLNLIISLSQLIFTLC